VITVSSTALDILTGSFQLEVAVDVWLGDQLIADDVPIASGSEDTDRTIAVPERVTLTLPRRDRGTDWGAIDSPIAANGQRLRVSIGIGAGGSGTEWFDRGWFLIDDVAIDGNSVQVTAVGLLKLLSEARLISPFTPTGTITTALRSLIEPALPVAFDAALTDRAVPAGVNYSDDRLGNVSEILDAWPAEAYVDESGVLQVIPVVTPTVAVASLTDGVGGTVVSAASRTSRDNAYNVVVARGTASDGGQVQGVAYDLLGAHAYGGPFNPLPVPFFYQSPLITTVAQAQSAASTRLATLKRGNGTQFDVECVPNPTLQVGDAVNVTVNGVAQLCTIEALQLPYTVGDSSSPQRLTVQVV